MCEDTLYLVEAAFYKACEILLLQGASPYEIDESMEEMGFEMGPYERQDLIGLDVAYTARKNSQNTSHPHLFELIVSDRMVETGKLGKQVNAGWYRYPGGNGKVEDPIVEDLVIEESWFAKIERVEFTSAEIQTFVFTFLCAEMAKLPSVKPALVEEYLVKALRFPLALAHKLSSADGTYSS